MKAIDFSNYAIVIHHCDNDGYLSGTLLRAVANANGVHDENIRYFRYTYSNLELLEQFIDDMLSQGILNENTYVLMGDISISTVSAPLFKRLFGFVKNSDHKWWFDHHRSSIEINDEDEVLKLIPGVRSMEYCASKLIWNELKDEIEEGFRSRNLFDKLSNPVIELVDDHDRFIHKLSDSRNFLTGSMVDPTSSDPSDYFWIDCLSDKEALDEVINNGKIISSYKKNEEAMSLRQLGFERTLILKSKTGQSKTMKVYCINRNYNSDIFGEKYTEYPIVCTFTYNGEAWKYTFYSSRDDACCDKIAQAFSPAGGGHPGAAGFTRSENLFNKLTVITPPMKCKLNDYFKEIDIIE